MNTNKQPDIKQALTDLRFYSTMNDYHARRIAELQGICKLLGYFGDDDYDGIYKLTVSTEDGRSTDYELSYADAMNIFESSIAELLNAHINERDGLVDGMPID